MDPEKIIAWAKRKKQDFLEGAESVRQDVMSDSTLAPSSPADWLGQAGTVLAALMIVQAATGLLMLFHYNPHPAKAFFSHVAIRNDVAFGLIVSNIHTIGAKLVVLAAFVHMFYLMFHTAFRGARKNQWYTGMGLLTALLFTGFSGYLLPWSQQSFWACVVGTEALKVVPLFGDLAAKILRGGDSVAGPTLARFYVLHVFLLPVTIAVLIWYHVKGVWKIKTIGPSDSTAQADLDECIGCGACKRACPFDAVTMTEDAVKVEGGESPKPKPLFDAALCNACRACVTRCPKKCISLVCGNEPVPVEPIFPHNILRRSLSVGVVLFALVFASYFLAGLFIAEKIPADPMTTPDRIKPDWYFLGPYQVLKILPSELWGLTVLFGVFALMVMLPAYDKKGPRRPEERPLFIMAVKFLIGAFIVLTFWGWVS